MQVGRIGDRQEQALAALEQRQHAMLGQQLVGDQPDGVGIEVIGVQVEQRHAELVGGGDGDVAGIGGAALTSWVTKLVLRSVAAFSASSMAGLFDHAVLHQPLRQAAEAGPRGPLQALREAFSFMDLDVIPPR